MVFLPNKGNASLFQARWGKGTYEPELIKLKKMQNCGAMFPGTTGTHVNICTTYYTQIISTKSKGYEYELLVRKGGFESSFCHLVNTENTQQLNFLKFQYYFMEKRTGKIIPILGVT